MTDTGSFRFSKTTPELHRKIANLLEYELNSDIIYNLIYSQYELSRNMMLGKSLTTIQITESGKTSYMVVTQEMLNESNGIEADVDGFVNYALNTKGVLAGILFFELEDGVKISFRSKGKVPVNLLAEHFGGGGHLNAAGTRIYDAKLNDILTKVVEKAEEILSNYSEE